MIGSVIIGRNEGQRLVHCFESIVGQCEVIVYVDSGSTDHSVIAALSMGIEVVELDLSIPFTAARARNNGFKRLQEIEPNLRYVQFIDGDCELMEGWLGTAGEVLDAAEDTAIVCGRLKERNPDTSLYNTLCDIEWDVPTGYVQECGGIFMVRANVFDQLGGFREAMIAGEEPELCVRVRQAEYSICRIEKNMAWHDAEMTHFSQWWKRAIRSGHADAEVAWLHGDSPERYSVRAVRRNWVWGGGGLALILMALVWPVMALFMLIYPVQIWRIYHHSYLYRSSLDRILSALFCVLSYVPAMFGQLKFHVNRIFGVKSQIIEYK